MRRTESFIRSDRGLWKKQESRSHALWQYFPALARFQEKKDVISETIRPKVRLRPDTKATACVSG